MFQPADETGYNSALEKIRMKTLTYGEKTLMVKFRFEAGARLPRHSHSHEQTGYLVSGRMDLTVGDCVYQVNPGDSWSIPGDVEHGVMVLEETVAIEVFSPVREDYLP